jgi:hypothetical protein
MGNLRSWRRKRNGGAPKPQTKEQKQKHQVVNWLMALLRMQGGKRNK